MDLTSLGRHLRTFALPALLCAAGFSQARLTLEQAASRTGADFTPAYEGQAVIVRGQVSTKPVWAVEAWYLPIQDEAEYGLLLYVGESTSSREVPAQLNEYEPGDWIEAEGMIARRSGMPVMLPKEIRRRGHASPPSPKPLRLQDLNSFRYLGLLVTTQSQVIKTTENGRGDQISIGDGLTHIDVFLPKMRRNIRTGMEHYRTGDMVRVVGISAEDCMIPPYDGPFQVLLSSAAGAMLVEKAWLVPPSVFLAALFLIMAVLGVWSLREHHILKVRRTLRAFHSVGEDVIASGSPGEIIRKLAVLISKNVRISGVGIFACNRQTQALDSFFGEGSAGDYAAMNPPASPILEAASAAFRNKAVLSVPDSRNSPLFSRRSPAPRSALFLPMFAQTELAGVLVLENVARSRRFSVEEQAALQHLANQVAGTLKMQEQQTLRENLFRSEKLASAGQLMSGIANELRSPMESIVQNLDALTSACGNSDPRIAAITSGAHRASEIIQRLLAFSRTDQTEAEPFDLNEMLGTLADLECEKLRSRRIAVCRRLCGQTLIAFGSREQLAQVIVNLLIYAEQSLAESRGQSEIRITSALLARRAIIEVSWPAGIDPAPDRIAAELVDKTGLSLEICHGIIQSHGGELRVSKSGTDVRFEIDVPVMETRQRKELPEKADQPGRGQLTVMVVDPEAASQRHVIGILAALGHRVVPVASAEEGADLAERMRFDLVVCALRLPGLNWAGLLERVRHQVSGVVLLADTYDPNLMRTFQSDDVFVITRPVDPADLRQICERIETGERTTALAH